MQRVSTASAQTGAPVSNGAPGRNFRTPAGRLTVLGTGWLGETLLRRWLAGGIPPAQLSASHRRPERREQLSSALGVVVHADNRRACASADVIVIGVRPQDASDLLRDLAASMGERTTVISLVAALDLSTLRDWIGPRPALCRALFAPTIGTGGGPVFVTTDGDRAAPRIAAASAWLDALQAPIAWVDDGVADALLVSVGGLPPFLALLLDTFARWLERQGIPRERAQGLLLEGLSGTARQFAADGHVGTGSDHAPTPGGLTEAALHALARGCVAQDLDSALDAMLQRGAAIASLAREAR